MSGILGINHINRGFRDGVWRRGGEFSGHRRIKISHSASNSDDLLCFPVLEQRKEYVDGVDDTDDVDVELQRHISLTVFAYG